MRFATVSVRNAPDRDKTVPALITEADLIAAGLTADAARSVAGAIERIDLDGKLCWDATDLAPLFAPGERGTA